ncbi:hypothetical protein RMCBS344292_09258 [Rhizopus microsporus]|nr:hypothetical protein RMCBS344292_09258 [Rhizopus microsporus]
MPVLEVYSAIAPKDLKSFIKRLSAVFAEQIENDRNSKLTAAITAELEKELGVSDNRGYFVFSDVAAENIGTRKTTFANIVRERQK